MKKRKRFVIDSFALISFFQREPGSEKVKEILGQALLGKAVIYLSAINLGEIYYITARKLGKNLAEEMLEDIENLPIKIEEATRKRILGASRVKAHYPLSYADAFVVSLGMEFEASIVTGDPEFKSVEPLVEILWVNHLVSNE